MRQFIYLAIAVSATLGFSGSAAGMTGPSEVVVVNDPLAVEVVNPTPPSQPVRFQLVGFTTTEFGNFSGVAGVPSMFEMIAACQAEVDPLSRMCRVDDIQLTTVIPSGIPTVDEDGKRIWAWLNPDPANAGTTTHDCVGWSASSGGILPDSNASITRSQVSRLRTSGCSVVSLSRLSPALCVLVP